MESDPAVAVWDVDRPGLMSASVPLLSIQTRLNPFDVYSDARTHGHQGPTRNVRLLRATPIGGGAIAKSEDGMKCAVTGKESLRILRVSDPSQSHSPEHKSSIGRGGYRIDASRNFWDSSGLKIDSVSTDIAWGFGDFNNKILTSARNGDLIMWDLNKSGNTKYERRTKDHIRSIHKMSVSHIVEHYCITGSADGDMRIWDLRDLSKSIMRVHHPTCVRSLVFSPSVWQPLQAVVGLDNGSIYRWDLRMGQRGQLDRLPVAHTGPVTSLDWCNSFGSSSQPTGVAGIGGLETSGTGLGWLVSGGLDRCVKIWDLTAPGNNTHIPHKPTYTLHPSFPVRRVIWRPSYECELAIVSNAEFGTGSNSELTQPINGPSSSTTTSILAQVGAGLGLDSMLRGMGMDAQHQQRMSTNDRHNPSPAPPEIKAPMFNTGGDAVEIWDVRRGWIAKWSVTGSSSDGGVTDVTFGDSHAIWAQHLSGMFSQIDLRDATKPLDAIPRASVTWESSGSLAFVADRPYRWELPYDDIRPTQPGAAVEIRKPSTKALGDPPARPTTQNMGTFAVDYSAEDLVVFTKLARSYVFEGQDRRNICAINAQVALEAGQDRAAHTWLFIGASLTECMPFPPTPPPSPPSERKQSNTSNTSFLHTTPPSVTISNNYSFPPTLSSRTSDSSSAVAHKTSPGRGSVHSVDQTFKLSNRSPSASTSRKMTPSSSTNSSPRYTHVSLPPITPRRPSFFGRRESFDSVTSHRPSSFRRPSMSTPAHHSASPSERATPSLRHVGEGALDDSDSSGSEEEEEHTAGVVSSDEELNLHPLISPALAPTRIIAAPSPLSQVAGQQQWTEDEDDPDHDNDELSSPSPQSTDTGSDGSSSPHKRTKSKSSRSSRRVSGRVKSRSRSSTVASLAAPPRPLVHQDSSSSIRTVTAGEVSFREQDGVKGLKGEETIRDIRSGHARQKSQAVSEFALDADIDDIEEEAESENLTRLTERKPEIVRDEEKLLRERCWEALRDALEDLADEGDIQMCAMMVLVAQEELQIPKQRFTRFLDSYIDLLTRLRLYTCAAYIRKYCRSEDTRNATLLETTIYTTCGKCRKPLLKPAGTYTPEEAIKGGFSYCLTCKASCVVCAICRLPVKSLLFQCSVCNHGGHQECYRQYYTHQPLIDLPTTFFPHSNDFRGRTSMRVHPQSNLEDDSRSTASAHSSVFGASAEQSPIHVGRPKTLAGHRCAAGCGHYCWAANGIPEQL